MSELNIIKMSDIKEEEIKWLWYPYIPYGKLTIIQGDPGDGKTTLALNIASRLSKGEKFEEGVGIEEPINIIYQTAEDGLADTIKPRLLRANANCERIMVIDESEKSLAMDDERLKKAIVSQNAKLLILDPIQAYLGNRVDMNRANEIREMTKKLTLLAEETKCAIVLIGHMNKSMGSKATYRGIGSIDIFAVARSVLLVGKIEENSSIRGVVQIKNNLAPIGNSKGFEIFDGCVKWLGDYEITADEILNSFEGKINKTERAKRLLEELAEQYDEIKSSDIYTRAEELRISMRTMDNVKRELGIRAKKIKNSWYWELSDIRK